MNIKCEYCGSEFDETLEKCPNCGASNVNVTRSTIDQPTTIEELKEWYSQRGLPPYETTRFFIGEDYKAPRAFGIYRDENSGKVVVYKNKDTGERAVRYEGTDEAYAVNELFMRLKQEILEQKSRNIGTASNTGVNETKAHQDVKNDDYQQLKKKYEYQRQKRNTISGGVIAVFVVIFIVIFTFAKGGLSVQTTPDRVKPGYYQYKGETYYHMSDSQYEDWLLYSRDQGDWSEYRAEATPLVDKKQSQKYFVSDNDYETLGCSDALVSNAYKDFSYNYSVDEGYYNLDGEYYYHEDVYGDYGWYYFDPDLDDWYSVSSAALPETLRHQYLAEDYTYTPDWNTDTYVSDFTTSEIYESRYSYDDSSYDSHSSYDSGSNSSYSSGHDSWWSSSDDSWSSSDSSWDWGGSDSWDSGYTDWGSDW